MAELRVEWEEPSAGPVGRRRPLRFGRGDLMRTAVELLDRWPGDGHCYYRVRGDDGSTYILRNDEREGSWRLVHSDAPTGAPTARPAVGRRRGGSNG